jgi:hypothetical protein
MEQTKLAKGRGHKLPTRDSLSLAMPVNTRSKVHQRAEVKIHQLERDDGLMVLLLAGGARGGSPPRCCCEELIS